MKKLVYIPFIGNIILLVYVVIFIVTPVNDFTNDFLAFCWGDLNMQYINPAEYILLLVSLIVPFLRVRIWLRIATPLLAIAHFALMTIFWDMFRYP